MVGGLIGKGGATIRALQSETGASVKVIDPVPDSDERVIVISAREVCL
jgi:poly(rC)-binding protein 2/3/4